MSRVWIWSSRRAVQQCGEMLAASGVTCVQGMPKGGYRFPDESRPIVVLADAEQILEINDTPGENPWGWVVLRDDSSHSVLDLPDWVDLVLPASIRPEDLTRAVKKLLQRLERDFGSSVDVAEGKNTEQELKESEERFRLIFHTSPDSIVISRASDGLIVDANDATYKLTGYRRDELVGQTTLERKIWFDARQRKVLIDQLRKDGEVSNFETTFCMKDGSTIIGLISARLMVWNSDLYLLAVVRDITEMLQTQKAIQTSERRLRLAIEAANEGLWERDVKSDEVFFSKRYYRMLGYDADEIPEVYQTWIDFLHPDDRDEASERMTRYLRGEIPNYENTFRLRTKSGDYRWITTRGEVVEWDDDGSPRRIVGVHLDVHDRILAERKLQESEAKYRALVENSYDIIARLDREARLLYVNHAVWRIFGLEADAVLGKRFEDLGFSEEFCRYIDESVRHVIAGGKPTAGRMDVDGPQGRVTLNCHLFPEMPEEGGEPTVLTSMTDVTELKQAQEERLLLQSQLIQSQKMEAIGRLAGGVAHDFNNLLTGITGNVSLAMVDAESNDSVMESLEQIKAAADRAADLNRQLLTFSRKRRVRLQTVDLNRTATNVIRMLDRLIGEEIVVRSYLETELTPVLADPAMIEQVLINLSVNARDAMPRGGTLKISTANVELDSVFCQRYSLVKPGLHARISVRDSGVGMTDEVLQHLFEPFFTTKAKGKGTGLGLAMVYGIVQQHRGTIVVDSRLMEGTRFDLYFPATAQDAIGDEEKPSVKQAVLPRGGERLLVVEDEKIVREIAVKTLKRQGYHVLSADGASNAMVVFENNPDIDLLLSDVVMPGLNGRELAEILTAEKPDLKVLLTSGYSEEIIAHHGVLDAGLNFLPKPYSPQELVQRVRALLDS